MRLVIGEIMQETNSFSSITASVEDFENCIFLEGNEILQKLKDTNTEVAGFVDVIRKEKCDSVYTLAANAVPSGFVQRKTLDFLVQRLLKQLRKIRNMDGIYIVLHGAMAVDEIHDGSGEILQAVRNEVESHIPIVASLDLHANLTTVMVRYADALVAYHTSPHTDMRETGRKATNILVQIVKGEIVPEMVFCKIPMLLPIENAFTYKEPALKIMQKIKEIETQPGVVSAFVCHVQPWLDVPNVGCSAMVLTNNNKVLAEKKAEELANLFWSLRHDFLKVGLVPVREAIQRAMNEREGPFIFGDSADSLPSGAAGDNTAVAKALLDMKVDKPCYVTLVDPEVVDLAVKAGVDSIISVYLGGKRDKTFSHPIKVVAKVKSVSDGVFKIKAPMATGLECSMGRTVVLLVGKIYIVVMERKVLTFDPALYRSVGLEPKDAHIVVVKCCLLSFYSDIAKEMIFVDTPGESSAHLTSLPYRHITRPIYPFDDMERYECRKQS